MASACRGDEMANRGGAAIEGDDPSLGVQQESRREREWIVLGNDAIGDELQLVKEIGVSATVLEFEIEFFEIRFGIREGGVIAFSDSIDRKSKGVDASLVELCRVLGEVFEFLVAGRTPTGPKSDKEGSTIGRSNGFHFSSIVEGVELWDGHACAKANGGLGGWSGENEFLFDELDVAGWRSPGRGLAGALLESEPLLDFESWEGFGFSSGPVHREFVDCPGIAEAKVKPFAGLS